MEKFIREEYFEPHFEPYQNDNDKRDPYRKIQKKVKDTYLLHLIIHSYDINSKSFFCFSITNPLRLLAIKIVESQFLFFLVFCHFFSKSQKTNLQNLQFGNNKSCHSLYCNHVLLMVDCSSCHNSWNSLLWFCTLFVLILLLFHISCRNHAKNVCTKCFLFWKLLFPKKCTLEHNWCHNCACELHVQSHCTGMVLVWLSRCIVVDNHDEWGTWNFIPGKLHSVALSLQRRRHWWRKQQVDEICFNLEIASFLVAIQIHDIYICGQDLDGIYGSFNTLCACSPVFRYFGDCRLLNCWNVKFYGYFPQKMRVKYKVWCFFHYFSLNFLKNNKIVG